MSRKKASGQTHADFTPQKAPKIRKGQREIEVSRFKLLTGYAKHNKSYKYKLPVFADDTPHVHWFRDFDARSGKPQVFASMVAGHTHRIEVDWDETRDVEVEYPDGSKQVFKDQPIITCSPAIVEVKTYFDPNQPPHRSMQPRVFANRVPGPDGQVRDIVDDHTHQVIYLDTEVLTFAQIQQIRAKSREEISAAMSPSTGQVNQAQRLQQMGAPSPEVQRMIQETAPE